MKVEQVAIEKIVPYENNPRINEQAIGPAAESIRAFGFRQPIVVDKNMVIIVGHTRLEAARQLGLEKVPVHKADLSDEQAKAYCIADNKTHEYSDWLVDRLKHELAELQASDFEMTLTGFNMEELDGILEGGVFNPVPEDEQPKLDERAPVTCPECGHEFVPSAR